MITFTKLRRLGPECLMGLMDITLHMRTNTCKNQFIRRGMSNGPNNGHYIKNQFIRIYEIAFLLCTTKEEFYTSGLRTIHSNKSLGLYPKFNLIFIMLHLLLWERF